MPAIPAAITVELIEHADGRPVAYIDATGIAIFAHQLSDGTYVVDICTRDRTGEQVRVLLDGMPVPGHCLRRRWTGAKQQYIRSQIWHRCVTRCGIG